MNSKRMLVLGAVAVCAIVAAGGYLAFTKFANHGRCLKDGERAVYEVLEKGRPGRVRVRVIDAASTTMWARELFVPSTEVVNGYALGRCHLFVHQATNEDYTSIQTLPGFVFYVWKFPFFSDGPGRAVVVTSEASKQEEGKRITHFGRSFTIDPSERYITLERGLLGKFDYALVIKEMATGKDALLLVLDEILRSHPNAAGSFSAGSWVERPDGTYLTGTIYEGPRWTAFYYIKRDTWETHIYETPADYKSGVERSAPPFAPYLAYTDFIIWTGLREGDDAVFDEQVAEGSAMKSLVVADLAAGATTTIARVPVVKGHNYRPTWTSDSELQYTMPDGTTRTHTVR